MTTVTTSVELCARDSSQFHKAFDAEYLLSSTEKLVELIEFIKVEGRKINTQRPIVFPYIRSSQKYKEKSMSCIRAQKYEMQGDSYDKR